MDSDSIITRQLSMAGYAKAKEIASIYKDKALFCDVLRFLVKKTLGQDFGPAPTSPTATYKYATDIAQAVKGIGFAEEFGYNNVLYPNAENCRSVLRFLLSNVTTQDASAPRAATTISIMSQSISEAQQEFTAALKSKEKREILVQLIPTINKGLTQATQQEISSVFREQKIGFIEVPVFNDIGIPFNDQCGRNSYATLISLNERQNSEFLNLDDFSKTSEPKKLEKIIKRAFQSATYNEVIVQPVKAAPVVKLYNQSKLLNTARFTTSNTTAMKIGDDAVTPVMVSSASTDSFKNLARAAGGETPEGTKLEPGEEGQDEEGGENGEKEAKLTPEQVVQVKMEQNQELADIKATLKKTEKTANEIEQLLDNDREELARLTPLLAQIQQDNERLKAEVEKETNLARVSSAEPDQIRKLKRGLAESTTSLMEIANEWEATRSALVEKYRELSNQIRNKNSNRELKVTKLNKLKRVMAEADDKVANSKVSVEELESALETRGDQLHRHHYIEMIFETIHKIEQQEKIIENVRNDYYSMNSRLNQTIETVKRTWALLNETIYSEAKKKGADWMRKSYKKVVDLLLLFENMSEDVEKCGKLNAKLMELESKIARVEEQSDPEALDRITKDLDTLNKEIENLQNGIEEAEAAADKEEVVEEEEVIEEEEVEEAEE